MKRKLTALMTVILVLSLAVAAIVPALAAESTGEAETGDAARTDAAEPAGQEKTDAADPAAAYVGVWECDRITLILYKANENYQVSVYWPSSVNDVTQWDYQEVTYDSVAGEMNTLETGKKTHSTYDENGKVATSETIYTDGAASFKLTADGKMVWTDYKEAPDANRITLEKFDAGEEDAAGETTAEADKGQTSDGLRASVQEVVDSPEWVCNLPAAKDENTKQLFVVAGYGMDKSSASVSMHQRDEEGKWKQILSTPALMGKNGMCLDQDHVEGCGQTPIGVYGFNKAFGIADDPGCAIPYVKVTDKTYWSGDEKNHYNEMVDLGDCPDLDLENSEHIVDYDYEYQYCLNISFNEDGTAGKGSAIFLHCLGSKKPYTGGCVAVPENIMKLIMRNVCEDCVVVIDTVDRMGVTF